MCKDDKSVIPFQTGAYYSTVNEFVFYPMSGWMPSYAAVRAAMRLLAEQGDGLDVTPAVRTATVRYDINGAAGLNAWEAIGASTSTDGDSSPQDIDISTNINGEFWLQLGIGVRKTAGAGAVGQGQAGVQFSLPTERLRVVGGPVNLDTVTTPVGDAWAELWATEWMSFYELREVATPYHVYDASGYDFKIVLQSVQTDPTQQAPAEDDVLGTTAAPADGLAIASTFSNASANKAQLFRVVFKARASGATEGTARAWFAVAVKYA